MTSYSILYSAQPVGASETIAVGDVVVADSSDLYAVSTTANRGTKRSTGVALTASSNGEGFNIAQVGRLSASVTGLAAGAASWARASSAGRLERVTVPASTDDVCGWVEADGSVHLLCGLPFAATSAKWADVTLYGAIGDGSTDDSSAVQAALSSTAGVVYVPDGTFIVDALTLSTSKRICGSGTLKHKATGVVGTSTTAMLTISGTSTRVSIEGITIDGNEGSQVAACLNKSVYFTATGTTGSPSYLAIDNVTFQDGCWADVALLNNDSRTSPEELLIRGCRFLRGREGTTQAYAPRYVDIRSPVNFLISGCLFDRVADPTYFGRCGVMSYDGHNTTLQAQRGAVVGNVFNKVGRSQANSTLGAIDLYDLGKTTVVSGNSITDPVGRGIQTKADGSNVLIVGNAIEGLLAGSDGTLAAQIVVNGSNASHTTAAGPYAIVGNTLLSSGKDGISVTCADFAGTSWGKGVVISGNMVSGSTRRGIGISDVSDCTVNGNVVIGGAIGIYAEAVQSTLSVTGNSVIDTAGTGINVAATCTGAWVNIADNTVSGTTGRGVYVLSAAGGRVAGNVVKSTTLAGIQVGGTTGPFRVVENVCNSTLAWTDGGSNTAIRVERNQFSTPTSFTGHLLTVNGSGEVTATLDWHYVDTFGGGVSSDLVNIYGGYDGAILTIRAANSARDIVVKDGTGNIRLAGVATDFTLDHSQDSLTLRWCNDAWIEIARSDNAT